MLGRLAERERIDRLLAEARTGGCGVLVMRGEPGIGKTTMLEYARERASGMRVLAAQGVESETGIPFGGLFELLRPAMSMLDRIPAPQAAALRAGLGLEMGGADDRFLVGAGTLSLLAAAAEDEPLAVLIDDFHWLDRPSAEAVVFAARRLVADPIAVIAAVRDGEASAFDDAHLPEYVLQGLDRDDTFQLVRKLGGRVPADAAVDRILAATGGNPLALVELSGRLDELSVELVSAPIPISERVSGAFLRRLRPLSDDARTALLLAAASDVGGLDEVSGACRVLGIDAASSLEEAEASGLATITDAAVVFRHPLARSTCYAAATQAARRAAHRSLAPFSGPDRRAWHLAQAAIGYDEDAASALAAAAARASARHAHSVASAAAERAAALTQPDGLRSERLLAAGNAAYLAGETMRALGLVEQAGNERAEPEIATALEELRGRITLRRGPITAGIAILLVVAREMADREPDKAVDMLAECVLACAYTGDTVGVLQPARLAREIAAGEGGGRAR